MLTTAIVLFVMGIALLLAEVFLPGGIVGIFGALCLVGSTVAACYAYPDYTLFIITGEVLSGIVTMGVGLYLITNTPLGDGIILKGGLSREEGYVSDNTRDDMAGEIAEVVTPLRPAGTIVLEGERIAAVSDGTYIDRGERVRIMEVHGNRVVVEQVQEQPGTAGGNSPRSAS